MKIRIQIPLPHCARRGIFYTSFLTTPCFFPSSCPVVYQVYFLQQLFSDLIQIIFQLEKHIDAMLDIHMNPRV